MEVWVVDNGSKDGSQEWLEPLFPEVKFIWNKENLGFSRANNQVLNQLSGEKVLFLNPDTLLSETVLTHCLTFMTEKPDVGAVGVKMVDGRGNFLWESKRAFPTASVSFFKMIGLTALFPRSSTFAKYHLGSLDEDVTHEVDILSGAFMMVRKEVLDKTGGFDERFFMYGEDIDLSYRIKQAGWKNYYLGKAHIVHFKGESTRKGEISYQRRFYGAMKEFYKKHFNRKNAGLSGVFILMAIQFRSFISILSEFFKKISTQKETTGLKLISRCMIVGRKTESEEFVRELKRVGVEIKTIDFADPGGQLTNNQFSGALDINTLLAGSRPNQVMFYIGEFGYAYMMDQLKEVPSSIGIRIHARGSKSVIASGSNMGQGDSYAI
jgi:GT2 family glycosyltransferase